MTATADQTHKEAVRAFIDAYNAHDLDEIGETISENFVAHGLPGIDGDVRGRDAYLDWVRATFEAFPDKRTEIEDLLAEGDMVAARWRSKATHRGPFGDVPATGRKWDAEALALVRIEDEKLAEMWFQPDQLGMLQQLGVVPDRPIA